MPQKTGKYYGGRSPANARHTVHKKAAKNPKVTKYHKGKSPIKHHTEVKGHKSVKAAKAFVARERKKGEHVHRTGRFTSYY